MMMQIATTDWGGSAHAQLRYYPGGCISRASNACIAHLNHFGFLAAEHHPSFSPKKKIPCCACQFILLTKLLVHRAFPTSPSLWCATEGWPTTHFLAHKYKLPSQGFIVWWCSVKTRLYRPVPVTARQNNLLGVKVVFASTYCALLCPSTKF